MDGQRQQRWSQVMDGGHRYWMLVTGNGWSQVMDGERQQRWSQVMDGERQQRWSQVMDGQRQQRWSLHVYGLTADAGSRVW